MTIPNQSPRHYDGLSARPISANGFDDLHAVLGLNQILEAFANTGVRQVRERSCGPVSSSLIHMFIGFHPCRFFLHLCRPLSVVHSALNAKILIFSDFKLTLSLETPHRGLTGLETDCDSLNFIDGLIGNGWVIRSANLCMN